MVVQACNPSIQEIEEKRSDVQSQPTVHSDFVAGWTTWDPVSKNKQQNQPY